MVFSKKITGNLKDNVKRTFDRGVDKFLSTEVQQELGLKKIDAKEIAIDEGEELSSFWQPVQSNLMGQKRREKFSAWVIGIVVFLVVLLMVLLFALIAPNSKTYDASLGNEVVIDGENTTKIAEAKLEDKEVDKPVEEMTSEDINVENIKVKPDSSKDIVANSPLLKSDSSVMEYKVQYGDTIEKIATKFYGSYNYDLIQKIKLANNIRNPRSLQIGQKLIIPF